METLKLQAYNMIKQKIIQCEYPPNTILNEEKLKDELNVSRTPIRDALSRLEQESLIHILPRRGIIVKGISAEEVEQIFEMRMLIEPYTLKMYGKTIDKPVLTEMEAFFSQYFEDIPYEVIHKRDDEFHHLFVNASQNAYLIEACKIAYIQNIRLRILCGNLGRDHILKSQQQHLKIARYCLEEAWEQASALLTDHLCYSKQASYNIITNLQILLNPRYY
ncbi:MAG: GntR family transcriptional regulator [Spirochaetaceae bacterium]|jgi:DNA-binding GntR family transcriptional regulator|nr:GntR family transcriptional regulator [Spirochaetaceae bacterium]